MRNSARSPQIIPMVQAVLDTLREGIESEEAAATELAGLADLLPDPQGATAAVLLTTRRGHAIKALELRGKRAALLAEYGLDSD